jgi:WD40 repeat protein
MLFVSSADRRLHAIKMPFLQLHESLAGLQDSPILSSAIVKDRYLLTVAMSGQLLASDLDGKVFVKRRDHSKYAVKIVVFNHPDGRVSIATAGWDCKVNIYQQSAATSVDFGEPTGTISLPSKPEAILFASHPDSGGPVLLLTRTDSNHVFYYAIEPEPRLLGNQNLAPHSNAWVAFTPSALALCPTDPTLIAVATSTVPHMKILIVRLLVPPVTETTSQTQPTAIRTSLLDDTRATETQSSQARAALAVSDREDAAIQIHCTSFAPQTAYSTPAIVWRPDGSGVWVNGDDGAIRGIEASTGKVMSTLQGHEEGSKVRCLWAGEVNGQELLISGGFDQRLIVWQAQ